MKIMSVSQVLIAAASISVAACGGKGGSAELPTSVGGQGIGSGPTGGGAPAASVLVMESSAGEAPNGLVPAFRVSPGPDADGVIRGESALTVEFDLCKSSPDAGKVLYFLFDWSFDHRPDLVGMGEACRQEHTYERSDNATRPQRFETNVCVVNGDPRGSDGRSLFFSCRSYDIELAAPPRRKPGSGAAGACAGTRFDPGNGITGCWYTAPALGMTCDQVCSSHGGFDSAASQHTGNAVGSLFWPAKANGGDWVSIECSSTDNNTNWGANGDTPDTTFSHSACYVNCACNQ